VLVRRLLILLAVLMVLSAVASAVAPRQPAPVSDSDRGAPASPAATAAGELPPLEATLSADEGAEERRLTAAVGQTVRLTVEGDVVDTVALGELEVEPIDPDSPALFELLADEPGELEITLLDAQRRIGVLETR
jgi:hypothetical protein